MTTTTTAPEYTAPPGFTLAYTRALGPVYRGARVEGEGWHFTPYWDALDGLGVSLTTAPDLSAADVRAMTRALDRLDRDLCAWSVTGEQWATITTAEPRKMTTTTAYHWCDDHGVSLVTATAIWDRLGMIG